jgi:hypothetical protein
MLMAAERRVGRPPLPGERYESGRRKAGDPRGRAIWNRLRDIGEQIGLDPRHASPLALLAWTGELTERQAEAGFLIARIYAAYERAQHVRRAAAAPSYVNALASDDSARSAEDVLEDFERRAQAQDPKEVERKTARAVRRWQKLQELFEALPPPVVGHARAIVEQVCVDGRPIHFSNIVSLQAFLDRVAAKFNVPVASAQAPAIAITASRPPRPRRDNPRSRRSRIDRDVWMATALELRPEATPDELEAAWQRFREQRALAQAKHEREYLRRRNERRGRR